MPTPGQHKENKPKKTYLDLIFPQKTPLFTYQSKTGRPEEEEVERVITDPDKLKKVLSHMMEGEGSVYFRRNERGGAYHCQIQLTHGNRDPSLDGTVRSSISLTGKTNLAEQAKPLLVVHNITPSPDPRQMEPGQNITIMFSFYGWHYRADVVVHAPATEGWVLSYPDRLTKIGRQRDCFRAVVNNHETCIYVIREAGCDVADPEIRDVGMGGCSFMPSPEEATMSIGSRIQITLEWDDPPEERNTVTVEGIIKAKSGNGLYHVVFTGLGALTKEAKLLGHLVAFLQTKRLSQTGETCKTCTSSACIKTTSETAGTCGKTGGSTSAWIPR